MELVPSDIAPKNFPVLCSQSWPNQARTGPVAHRMSKTKAVAATILGAVTIIVIITMIVTLTRSEQNDIEHNEEHGLTVVDATIDLTGGWIQELVGVIAIIAILGSYKIISRIVKTRCKKENASAKDTTRPHDTPEQQKVTAEGAAATSSITLDQEAMTAIFKNAIQEAKELTDEDDTSDVEKKKKRNRRKRYQKE